LVQQAFAPQDRGDADPFASPAIADEPVLAPTSALITGAGAARGSPGIGRRLDGGARSMYE